MTVWGGKNVFDEELSKALIAKIGKVNSTK